MKALRLHSPARSESQPLRLESVADPTPGNGELLIAVQACGVCHTDLHIVEGEVKAPAYPVIPGHQVVGIVESVGPGVESSWLGKRVGMAWLAGTCGHCEQCLAGRENLCENAEFSGLSRAGGFATKAVCRASYAVELPPALGDSTQVAPLLCAGIIGLRALTLCGANPGDRLGLFGFGASAHLVLQLARAQDMEVYVFTRNPRARAVAQRLGAAWTGGEDDEPRVRLDGAISFTPAGRSLRLALERVGAGGTVACAGIYLDAMPALDYEKHLFHEKTLRSVTAATRADAQALIAHALRHPLQLDTEVVPWTQANEVLCRLKHGQLRAAAAVLDLHRE